MNSEDQRARAAALRELHRGPKILVLPNAWDCVSARLFELAGFPAIATTSGGIAATLGYPDGEHIPPSEMLQMVRRIAATVSIPVTADLEAGYGTSPQEVAKTIREAIACGAAGANIEDGRGPTRPLASIAQQVDIIKAIREAASACDSPFVLNARVDLFLRETGGEDERFSRAVERAVAYRNAGADCIFPIGLNDGDSIARFVRETNCPVNIMAGHGAPAIPELEKMGVRRVTFGTGTMRAVLPFIRKMANDLQAAGGSDLLDQQEFSHATVNGLFKA